MDQVAEERALVGLDVLAPQKKSFLRQGGEGLESLRRVLVQAQTEGSRPGVNRLNFDAKRTREPRRDEKEKIIEAMRLKMISLLRGHVAQLIQSIGQFYLPLDEDKRPIYRTTSTGTLELRTTLSATLPRRNRSRPEAPM